jgi:uncharacterized NAD(P)/FAD-binding protein YdhS
MTKIAVIGGGFSGVCVTANIIRMLRKKNKFAQITLFEPNKSLEGGRAFSPDLPDNFKLNHEANYMGAINPFSKGVVYYDDFYLWLKKNKRRKLESLAGDTLTNRYAAYDFDNPSGYPPRSMFSHYILYRFHELLAKPKGKNYTFQHKNALVTDVATQGETFIVSWLKQKSIFDVVILSTGFTFSKTDNSNSVYLTKEVMQLPKVKPIGIIGSSLSAIEIALALQKKGYKDITMYSRHARLPKVRGKISPYTTTYVTPDALNLLQNKFGYIKPHSLFALLKQELDYAYSSKNRGLYQKKGINWEEILHNANPLQQLDEDINTSEMGEEIIWRSVLSSFYKLERYIWRGVLKKNREQILSMYSSLLLSYIGPMPLEQAKLLSKFLHDRTIKLVGNVGSHEKRAGQHIVILKNGERITHETLIDARGPAKSVSNNQFLSKLIKNELLDKNPAGGIVVSAQLQVMKDNKIHHNMYALGPMVYGQRPHLSTVFMTDYAEYIAAYIVNSIYTEKELKDDLFYHTPEYI